jgi:hypothetical protein
MSFPKSPSKPVSGKLKLVIKNPTEVIVDASPTVSDGPDDGELKFKLPAGFGLDMDLGAVLERQLTTAHKSITEIEKRYLACSNCRRKDYNPEGIAAIRLCIDLIGNTVKDKISVTPKILLAHEKNGNISLEATVGDRSVIAVSTPTGILLGTYNRYVIHEEAPMSRETYEKMLLWTVGYE